MTGLREMGPAELRSRLLEFDQAVALRYPGQSFRLVLVGGGAMLLLGYLERPTLDLDVLAAPAALQALMADYDLSGQVAAYEDHFAFNLEDRLVQLNLQDHRGPVLRGLSRGPRRLQAALRSPIRCHGRAQAQRARRSRLDQARRGGGRDAR